MYAKCCANYNCLQTASQAWQASLFHLVNLDILSDRFTNNHNLLMRIEDAHDLQATEQKLLVSVSGLPKPVKPQSVKVLVQPCPSPHSMKLYTDEECTQALQQTGAGAGAVYELQQSCGEKVWPVIICLLSPDSCIDIVQHACRV